ncbi:MAG: ASKHA domain-containing protein [Anaerolineae bacterium]|nr:ASKHA domain-containing protein [Anaerolineae bacterium]
MYVVHFEPAGVDVQAPAGTLIEEAARQAGIELNMPCGGQGRCGRCAVIVDEGKVRRRSTLRLSPEDVAAGFALACQTVIEGDVMITVPPQERIERRLTTEKQAVRVVFPYPYDPQTQQPIQRFFVSLEPPSLDDQVDDWGRLQRELRRRYGLSALTAHLPVLQELGRTLRQAEWQVTAVVELDTWDRPQGPPRLIDLLPGDQTAVSWGAAVDIGTTTVTAYLVNLLTGEVVARGADYNAQIGRGEDIISRIVYASKGQGLVELQRLVRETINTVLARACRRGKVDPRQVHKVTVAGNTTMLHLLQAVPPEPIRLTPYIPTVNHWPSVRAEELGLAVHPQATVDCLPGVASYVGADITAGVISTGVCDTRALTLFLDIGTNGEMVLGDCDWLVSCACSAGPAFEGAGVDCGMRATEGAIEEVWISGQTYEPTYRVIGNERPRGICGSGLISLLAEMFITGVVDKGGNLNFHLPTPRVREGRHGGEYVVAWGSETEHGRDIVITKVDIDNLLRAKAAVYAGFSVLARSVGLELSDAEQVLIGGAFGQYINVEKAIQIGLLPDVPWEKFQFLGNTSVRGATMALLSRDMRRRVAEVAERMTYLELSADNTFYEEFTSALFLPHTDMDKFPSVAAVLRRGNGAEPASG